MQKLLDFLILPSEVTEFERGYLGRVNRIALMFFALHVPAFTLIAWLNDTGPLSAALLTLAVISGPFLVQRTATNPRLASVVYGITAMFTGGLLVHFGQGPVQIEMHFYFFALIAMCAVFGNPLVIVAAAVTVALHHFVVWLALPRSVFNYEAQWWVVGVHAAFVVLESVAACFISRSFFDNVIRLERIVHARTQELDSKNRDMRLLLDNVQQGFLTIDRQGRMAQERSAVVERWFGLPTADATWFHFLATFAPAFAEYAEASWEQVVDGMMPLEVSLEQMPAKLSYKGAHYRFEYRPIGATEPHENYLVIVTDVTTEVERERGEVERREAMVLFERVLVDRAGLESFFEEGNSVLTALGVSAPTDVVSVKRMVHTLKGNAGLFGLFSIAERCHQLEDLIAESDALPPPGAFAGLQSRWSELGKEIEKLLGARSHTLEIDDRTYAGLEAAARAGETGAAMLRRIHALKLEATAKRLRHFQEQGKRIAERLGKGDVRLDVEDNGVRLDHVRWASFWSAFVHAVRNALDHGIEPAEDRLAAGKNGSGAIMLRSYEDEQRVVIEVADDGRGIDWQRVAEKAAAAGLPTETPIDLERALFSDGLSTSRDVTDVSGRGVGMGALLHATQSLGGEVSIQSQPKQGTTLRFVFPPSARKSRESGRPVAAAE
jgi:two-component system, chemotaxis family, sensor kinase CheA